MSKESARGPEGKTELPHKLGLGEGAIDLKPRKMSPPFPKNCGLCPALVAILSGKGETEMEELYSRAVSGPCFTLVVSFLFLDFSSDKP